MVADTLKFVCLPPFFLARVELAGRLESITGREERREKGLNGTDVSDLILRAKWCENNATANEAIISLAATMVGAGFLDLEQLKAMAREAMLATKPKR